MKKSYRTFILLVGLAAVISGAAIEKLLPSAVRGTAFENLGLIVWLQTWGTFVSVSIAGMSNLALFFEPGVRRGYFKNFVDMIHDRYMPDQNGAGNQDDRCRVTILAPRKFFICLRPFKVRIGKQLVPLCRSGNKHQRGHNSWSISDDRSNKFDGIAGAAWFSDQTVYEQSLPDITDLKAADPKMINDYCERTHSTREQLSRISWLSRSYYATRIKSGDNQVIGVLVLESLDPKGLERVLKENLRNEIRTITNFVGRI